MWLQAMGRASDEGLIFIEGTGPTYATETVMLYVCALFAFTCFLMLIVHALSYVVPVLIWLELGNRQSITRYAYN